MNNIIIIFFQIYFAILFMITFVFGVVLILVYALTRKHRGINYEIIFTKLINISQNPIKLEHQINQHIDSKKYQLHYENINNDLYIILKNNKKIGQQYINLYLLLKKMKIKNIDDVIVKLIIINCNL